MKALLIDSTLINWLKFCSAFAPHPPCEATRGRRWAERGGAERGAARAHLVGLGVRVGRPLRRRQLDQVLRPLLDVLAPDAWGGGGQLTSAGGSEGAAE